MLGKIQVLKRLYNNICSYRKKETKVSGLPLRLWVEPTNFCNLKCIMCPNAKEKPAKSGYMDMDLFKHIIDEVSPYIYEVFLFFGGESLLHQDIVKMIKYAKDKKLRTVLHTNSTLLTAPLSEEIINSDLDEISLSLDGYTKEIYEKIRVNGDFEDTFNKIRDFLIIRKKLNKKKPYSIIQNINFAAGFQKETKILRESFVNRFKGALPDEFRVSFSHSLGGAMEENDNFHFTISKNGQYRPCIFPWFTSSITWDGKVVPCCVDFKGTLEVGDITKEKLSDIWNNEKMITLRSRLINKDALQNKVCGKCDYLYWEMPYDIPTAFIQAIIEGLYGRSLVRVVSFLKKGTKHVTGHGKNGK